MALPSSIIGSVYSASQIAYGSVSPTPPAAGNGAGPFTFTDTDSLANLSVFNSTVGPAATLTVTGLTTNPVTGVQTITGTISDPGTLFNGQTVTGTVIGNDVNDFLASGNAAGFSTNLYFANSAAQLPAAGGTATVAGAANSPDYTLVCYVSGTLLRAWRDGREADVPVEQLAVGDLVVTSSGGRRPVRWLGSRTVDCRRHLDPAAVQPVRIRAGAFGLGLPARDLRVSPGHSVCVDMVGEVLVPASALVNGATVARDDVEHVTYWHVELDSHDLLLAEGMPAESYLDMGNRTFFGAGGVVELHATPDGTKPAERTHANFCRPFHGAGSPVAEFLRGRLHARAEALGWRLDGTDPWAGVHLLVDGARVAPDVRGLQARFALPPDAQEVWLVSQAGVPHEIGHGSDGRRLGLHLASLRLDDGWCEPRQVDLNDPLLCVGFHAAEGGPEASRRWTAGRARLPAALWAGLDGAVSLRVDLAGPALPRWTAPAMAGTTVADAAAA